MFLQALSEKISLASKTVILRVDFNVPYHQNGEIEDDIRITSSLPTIYHLLDKNCKVILISHLGRPKGTYKASDSLYAVFCRLKTILPSTYFSRDPIGSVELETHIKSLQNRDVLLLENIRFYKEEEENDVGFSKLLSKMGDVYVNDAFGTCHRKHASTFGIVPFMEHTSLGFLIEKELHYLKQNLKRPLLAIIGGSKISTKIGVLTSLLDKVDKVFIGGAMVFTFLMARGFSVGNSLVEEDKVDIARQIEHLAIQKGVELILPIDFQVVKAIEQEETKEVVSFDNLEKWIGVDHGPHTSLLLEMKILENNFNILWNGPVGMFEVDAYADGTRKVFEILSKLPKETSVVLGGGDTLSAMKKFGFKPDDFTHASTGGGVMLELLEGKKLPVIEILQENK